MIIWSGWGFLTAVIAGVALAIASGPAEAYGLPFNICLGAALAASAGVNFLVARRIGARSVRELIDAKTGQRVVFRDRSSLFFIPMRFWTYGLLALAAVSLALAPAQLPPHKGYPARSAAHAVGV